MPFDVDEYGDDTVLKCSNCKKTIASEYSPFSGPSIKITREIFERIQKHKCKKRKKSSRTRLESR